MDIQLQELLDKIKREGVEAAEAEAARIAAEAESAKAAVIKAAESEASAIVQQARLEAAKVEEASRAALAQTSRDFLLAFRHELESVLAAAVARETATAYGPEVLAEAIPLAVKALVQGGAEDLSVLVPESLLAAIDSRVSPVLAAELAKGVTIRPSKDVEAGFRIVEKGGAAYYDFSASALAEIFASRMNARLAESLRSAAKGL